MNAKYRVAPTDRMLRAFRRPGNSEMTQAEAHRRVKGLCRIESDLILMELQLKGEIVRGHALTVQRSKFRFPKVRTRTVPTYSLAR